MSDPTAAQLRTLVAIRDGYVERVFAWSGTGARVETHGRTTRAVVNRCIESGWAEWQTSDKPQTHACVPTRAGELFAPASEYGIPVQEEA